MKTVILGMVLFVIPPSLLFSQSWPNIFSFGYDTWVMKSSGSLLYIGGNHFDMDQDTSIHGIGAWNGTTWNNMAGGINNSLSNMVIDIEVTGPSSVYIAGNFSIRSDTTIKYIASWNGSTWLSFGGGTNGGVNDICLHNGQYYIGGVFTMAGGNPITALAMWNGGSWVGVNYPENNAARLCSYGGNLYTVTFSGKIYVYNGVAWTFLDQLVTSQNFIFIRDMIVYNNELFISGQFEGLQSSLVSLNLVKYNGATFLNAGLSYFGNGWQFPEVNGMLVTQGKLLITGVFDTLNTLFSDAVGFYDGFGWNVMSSGMYSGFSLEEHNGYIYGSTRNYIKRTPVTTLSASQTLARGLLRVYPNPAEKFIRFISDQKVHEVRIMDLTGQILFSVHPGSDFIPVMDFPAGLYIIELLTEQGIVLHDSFIKQ